MRNPISILFKTLYWTVGLIFVVLLVAVFSVSLSPSLQRLIALNALHRVSKEARLESLHMGWNHLELKGLYVLAKKGAVAIQALDLDASFLSFLMGDSWTINNLNAQGLEVDLSSHKSITPAKATAGAAYLASKPEDIKADELFEGLEFDLKRLNIIQAKLEGELYFADKKTVTFDCSAQGIELNKPGTVLLNIQSKENKVEMARVQVKAQLLQQEEAGKLAWHFEGQGTGWSHTGIADLGPAFATLGMDFAWEARLKDDWISVAKLEGKLINGEKASLVQLNLAQPITLGKGEAPIAALKALDGTVLTLETQAFPLGLLQSLIPHWKISGMSQPLHCAITAHQGDFGIKTVTPWVINPISLQEGNVVAFDNLIVQADIAGSIHPFDDEKVHLQAIQAQTFNFALKNAQGNDLLSLILLNPINIAFDKPFQSLLQAQGELLAVNINSVPLSILNAFNPNMRFMGSVGGFESKLLIQENAVHWDAAKPIELRDVSITKEGVLIIDHLNGWIKPTFEGGLENFKISMSDINLKNTKTGSSWLSGSLEGNGKWVRSECSVKDYQLSGRCSLGLVGLMTQPIFSKMRGVQSGDVLLSVGLHGENKANGALTFALATQNYLPAGMTTAATQIALNQSITWQDKKINGTLTADCQGFAGKTEATITYEMQDNAWLVDFKSPQVYVDDLLALGSAFEAKVAVAEAIQPQSHTMKGDGIDKKVTVVADSVAFWSHLPQINGKLMVGHVFQSGGLVASNVIGRFRTDAQTVSIDSLTGSGYDATFNIAGNLDFQKQSAAPYTLTGKARVKDLNVAKLMELNNPGTRAPIEGLFNIDASVSGQGVNQESLMQAMQGEATIKSDKGTLYVLGAAGKKAQVTAMALGIAGSILGKTPGPLEAANQLTDFLQSIDYDHLVIQAQRGSNLNINLTQCVIQGPTLRILGQGQITHQPQTPIFNQPLIVKADLNALGNAADLFTKLGLLKNERDDAGYYVGPHFRIRGTLEKPNFDDLYGLIAKAGASLATSGATSSASDAAASAKSAIKNLFKL